MRCAASPRLLLAALIAAAVLTVPTFAGDAGYKDLKIQDLLGGSWWEFVVELDSLRANPRNEDAFYRMYKIAQRSDAESKVPQFLLKLTQEHPEQQQIQTLLGMFYRENRDYAQAMKYFREALKKSPDDYFVHYQIAHLLGKQDGENAIKEALEHYAKAAERIGASDVELKTRLLEEWGQLLIDRSGDKPEMKKQARDAAAQIWDRLIADERRFDKITYERLAQIYQRYEMWEKAIGTWRLCLTNVVGDDYAGRVRVLDQIGENAEHLGDITGACAAYSDALGLVDETHWLHKQLIVKLVKAHKKQGDDKAFLAELKKAAGNRPQSTAPLRDLALAFESVGDVPSTIGALEQAEKLAPRDVTIISDLLLQYTKAGGPRALALKAGLYRKLVEIMPENFDAYAGLADTHWEMGDTAQVQAALTLLQNTVSTLPEKYLVMAGAFKKYGMKSNARNAYERALAGGISGSDAALDFCDFCLASAETEKARDGETFQRALELRNGLMGKGSLDESGYLRMMQVFQTHNRPDEARDIIGYAATNVFPKSFVCRYALADLHYSRKEFHMAIQHYVAALTLAPGFYFKRMVNDRIITLCWNYGRHSKDFMSDPTEEEKNKKLLGGAKGEGLAPWIYYLQALVASDPQNSDNMMLLAQINENTRVDAKAGDVPVRTDVARAKALYKSVVDMDLKNLDAHNALARTLVATDEFEGAIQENWILEELSPAGKWQYIMNVGDLWALSGYQDKALSNWNTVGEQATTEPNLVYQLGCRMFQLGKIDEAIAWLRKAVSANKNEFRFHTALGNLLDLSAENDGVSGARDDAVSEFKIAVELAGQNPALTPYLQPVLRRLLEVEIRLARSRYTTHKFADCAQTCTDALAAIEKLHAGAALTDAAADIQVLRARALLSAGQNKEGDALLRETLAAHSSTLYWYDEKVKMTGKRVLALHESGKLSQQIPELPATQLHGFTLAPCNVIAMPGRIGALQNNSNGTLFVESGSRLYRTAIDPPETRLLKLEGSGAPVKWLGGECAAIVESSSFSVLDLERQAIAWKKEIFPTALFANELFVACFYTQNGNPSDTPSKAASVPRSFLQLMDKKTGAKLWEREVPNGDLVFNEKFLIVRSPEELSAINLKTGEAGWRTTISRGALWRRPVVAHETIVLADDMTNEVYAYDLSSGELKFQRALNAALLCEPSTDGQDRVICHILRKRVVTLECFDTVTGKRVWESALHSAANSNETSAESLGGIALAPIAWNGWLLHFDAPNRRIWSARIDNGSCAPPITIGSECDPKTFDGAMGWGVLGDTLYVAARSGHIAWIKLVK